VSKQKERQKEQEAQSTETPAAANPDVVIVRSAEAAKLSPRGEGGIAYQVGRVGGDVYVRIEKNHGGGSCSKEWVPVEKIRACITPAMRRGEPFKSGALAAGFAGRSQCNSGFLVAVLRAEGIFSADPEHKGMSRMTGDLDAWEKAMREVAPVLKDDGQPETAKLRPEPKETKFRPKQAAPSPDDAPQGDGAGPPTDGPPTEGAPQDGDAKPKRRLVRISRKVADELGVAGKSEAAPADAGESAASGGGADTAVA
jgi:hypothetical protein